MSANLYKNQSVNVRKTWILMSVFFAFVVSIGWFISFYYNNVGIFYFAIIFSILINIFSYWNSDKIVLKISGAKPVKREEYFDLYNLVENLSITAGLPMPKVYLINDPVPNAFATGRDKNHSAVAFTTGLLAILDKTELEGVVAHELAHIGNRDILLQTIVVTLVGLITLLADWFWRINFHGKGGDRDSDSKAGSIIMIVGIILMILSPIIATLIQLAISRKREFLADSTGALLTRYPEGLAGALDKISSHSGKMQKANHATAHLYIADPYGADARRGVNLDSATPVYSANNFSEKTEKVSFLTKMFMTHPPMNERIANLRGLKID